MSAWQSGKGLSYGNIIRAARAVRVDADGGRNKYTGTGLVAARAAEVHMYRSVGGRHRHDGATALGAATLGKAARRRPIRRQASWLSLPPPPSASAGPGARLGDRFRRFTRWFGGLHHAGGGNHDQQHPPDAAADARRWPDGAGWGAALVESHVDWATRTWKAVAALGVGRRSFRCPRCRPVPTPPTPTTSPTPPTGAPPSGKRRGCGRSRNKELPPSLQPLPPPPTITSPPPPTTSPPLPHHAAAAVATAESLSEGHGCPWVGSSHRRRASAARPGAGRGNRLYQGTCWLGGLHRARGITAHHTPNVASTEDGRCTTLTWPPPGDAGRL